MYFQTLLVYNKIRVSWDQYKMPVMCVGRVYPSCIIKFNV